MTIARQGLIAPIFFFTAWISAFGWMLLRIG